MVTSAVAGASVGAGAASALRAKRHYGAAASVRAAPRARVVGSRRPGAGASTPRAPNRGPTHRPRPSAERVSRAPSRPARTARLPRGDAIR